MKYNDYFEKIIEEYSDKITNRKKGVVIWGNTDIGACLAEYCLKNKIPVFAIIDKRTEEFVPITYRSGLSSVEVVNVPVMQYENFLSDDSLFIVIAANQASNEIVSIVQKNNWQYLVLHDYIDIQNNTNPEIILRRYKEQRNLVNVLYSFQEYQSDLIVDGIYRNALVVTTAVGCPIKCRYCPQDNFIKSYCKHPGNEIKFLSFTDYKNYLAKVPSGTIVSFTGFVEPFVNSECLKMIQYTLDKGYKVRVFSTMYNQSIADYESFAHHENLKTFDLHLPDTDSNTVFPITERYKELLQHIVFNKPKYGRFWTSLLGVGTQVKEEIRNIIDVTPNAINSVHSLVYENGLNHGNASLSCKYDCSRIDNLQAGIIMLLPNGNITVCTQDWELKHIIGNINEFDDWESILTSPKRINFRDGMTNPQIKNICRTCELAVKVNASDIN